MQLSAGMSALIIIGDKSVLLFGHFGKLSVWKFRDLLE